MSSPSPIDPEGGVRPTTAKRLEWLARIERWLDVPMPAHERSRR